MFGGGKMRERRCLWLIQVVRDILLDTEQTIVTNFAVKLPDLNAWLQENHPDRTMILNPAVDEPQKSTKNSKKRKDRDSPSSLVR